MTEQNYWDQALKGAQEESGPGKPVIGRGRVELAYFAFASGYTGEDRKKCIVRPKGATEEARDKALRKAQKLCTDSGKEASSARWCIITTIYQDEAIYADGNEIETWNGDQIDPVPLWPVWDKHGNRRPEPSAGGLIWDTVNKLKIEGGKDFYGKFGWIADPHFVSLGEAGKTKEVNTDNGVVMRYPAIVVVQEVFKSREDAANAVGESDNGSGSHGWAEGWSSDELTAMVQTFTDEKDNYSTFAEMVEDEAGEDEAWGIKLLSEIGEMDVDDIAKFTGMKKGKIRKALS